MISSILRFVTDEDYRFLVFRARGLCNRMPDEEFIKRLYHARIGDDLDLDNPVTFNEKLQWLKLYDHNPSYVRLVDKYEMKAWASSIIGSSHIVKNLGVWDCFDDIDFASLPRQFVLKCTHDSGTVSICNDKSSFDYESAKRLFQHSLNRNYYWVAREWPYKYIKPRVIAEEYLSSAGSDNQIEDYKVLCFSGTPRLIEVHKGRFSNHTQNWFDTDWNSIDLPQPNMPKSTEPISKPKDLNDMLRLSAILSSGMPHVRVDWYQTSDRLLLGEMTLYDGAGFEPFERKEDDIYLGSLIDITELSRNL